MIYILALPLLFDKHVDGIDPLLETSRRTNWGIFFRNGKVWMIERNGKVVEAWLGSTYKNILRIGHWIHNVIFFWMFLTVYTIFFECSKIGGALIFMGVRYLQKHHPVHDLLRETEMSKETEHMRFNRFQLETDHLVRSQTDGFGVATRDVMT